MSTGIMVNPLERVMPTLDIVHPSQREQIPMPKDPLTHKAVLPSTEIIGEGAAIFTDMTETILDTLDCQIAMVPDTQQSRGLIPIDYQIKKYMIENQQLLNRKKVILIYSYQLQKIADKQLFLWRIGQFVC